MSGNCHGKNLVREKHPKTVLKPTCLVLWTILKHDPTSHLATARASDSVIYSDIVRITSLRIIIIIIIIIIVNCVFVPILDFTEFVHFIFVLDHALLHSYPHHWQ